MSDPQTHSRLLQREEFVNAMRRRSQMAAFKRQQDMKNSAEGLLGSKESAPPQPQTMGSLYDDLPIRQPADYDFVGPAQISWDPEPAYTSASRHGPIATLQTILSSAPRTPAYLHHGLILALIAGNAVTTQALLSAGAPIVRATPTAILSAPTSLQVQLFALLFCHGWTPNTPGHYGAVLLPRVVGNHAVLAWFLAHGADPNLGPQSDFRSRNGKAERDSCAALEAAAWAGDVTAVRMLLNSGARIDNGFPLHSAARRVPQGMNPHVRRVLPSKKFDTGRIAVMVELLNHGADINSREKDRGQVAGYAVVEAVMAGAVQAVRWLLEHGADPEARGAWGSAVEYARAMGSVEMINVVEEGVRARKWVRVAEEC